MLLKDT